MRHESMRVQCRSVDTFCVHTVALHMNKISIGIIYLFNEPGSYHFPVDDLWPCKRDGRYKPQLTILLSHEILKSYKIVNNNEPETVIKWNAANDAADCIYEISAPGDQSCVYTQI